MRNEREREIERQGQRQRQRDSDRERGGRGKEGGSTKRDWNEKYCSELTRRWRAK